MFAYNTWGSSWGNSWGGSWGSGDAPPPAQTAPIYGGGLLRRWHIQQGRKKKYFDTAQEAYDYLILLEEEANTPKVKKAKHIGKAIIKYADVDVSTVNIDARKGDEIFRLGDSIFLSALMRRIEQAIEEDEEISVLLLLS